MTRAGSQTGNCRQPHFELSELAQAYLARGWALLPLWWPRGGPKRCACPDPECGSPHPDRPGQLLGSPAKHPIAELVPHGLVDASHDVVQVRGWWRRFPAANLGLRTGAQSGLVVLDVDGEAGAHSLRALVRQHQRFRAAWARTGSGGWHAYLAHPGGELPNSAGRLGAGLDVRGDGGYVVAPPSLHARGQRYRWRAGPPWWLPPMPSWLAELARPPAAPPVQPLRLDRRGQSPYVLAALEGEAREVAQAPQGQRNQRLNLAAFRLGGLVAAGVLAETVMAEVLLLAARTAGLGEREAQATIRSGLQAGARRPRVPAP